MSDITLATAIKRVDGKYYLQVASDRPRDMRQGHRHNLPLYWAEVSDDYGSDFWFRAYANNNIDETARDGDGFWATFYRPVAVDMLAADTMMAELDDLAEMQESLRRDNDAARRMGV